jgi:hypothetical protein
MDPRILTFDEAVAADAFGKRTFPLRHALADHELFRLEALGDLADQLPPDAVEHNLGSVGALEPGGDVPTLDQSPGEIVRGIESNGCWVVLPFLHKTPPWDAVLADVFGDLSTIVPGGRDAMLGLHSVVFLAAPGSTTPSHVDPELGFLMHIRGEKRLSIGRFADGTGEEELDRFYAGGHRNTSELPVDVEHIDLQPGEAAHVPPHTPHWVTNGPGVTVALSVGFQTEANLEAMRAHRFNGSVVRRLGITPRPVGAAPSRDRIKARAVDVAAGARRLVRREA